MQNMRACRARADKELPLNIFGVASLCEAKKHFAFTWSEIPLLNDRVTTVPKRCRIFGRIYYELLAAFVFYNEFQQFVDCSVRFLRIPQRR